MEGKNGTDYLHNYDFTVKRMAEALKGETSYGNDNTFATLPVCPDCTGDPVELTNKIFGSETNCECTSKNSITLKDGVKIESGANVIFSIRP